MKSLFFDTRFLDKRATKDFLLSPEILMENAARGMKEFILPYCKRHSKILFVCGNGDNGADCLALARMLCGKSEIYILLPLGVKSSLCHLQLQRLKCLKSSTSLHFIENLREVKNFDIIIDGVFGVGFKGEFSEEICHLFLMLNKIQALKVACDIPSGIDRDGNPRFIGDCTLAFHADFTLTMGALKVGLLSDYAKEFVGDIVLLSLGIDENIFIPHSPIKLLEKKDFVPPFRYKHDCHKGSFGHLSVFIGQKSGAGILAALAGLRIGAGLVSVIGESQNVPFEIMQVQSLPKNTTAILLGMGYGENSLPLEILENFKEIPLLLDADSFYTQDFKVVLRKFRKIILTPHPKEFSQILQILEQKTIDVQTIQKNRVTLACEFSEHYPNTILILKGANTLIAQNGEVWINPFGENTLAKGGSGDVLAGFIGGYLAQGYDALDSCIQGVLAHSFCAKNFSKKNANFSLSPLDLIEQIRYI
ncbi:MAG: NAD(P)H-hydrate dehydratase [Helicobacter sp.]|nr:NAD(P)H-hydrate dehydratase [Helicobacter sp.]